jgi:hypothetical protein
MRCVYWTSCFDVFRFMAIFRIQDQVLVGKTTLTLLQSLFNRRLAEVTSTLRRPVSRHGFQLVRVNK